MKALTRMCGVSCTTKLSLDAYGIGTKSEVRLDRLL